MNFEVYTEEDLSVQYTKPNEISIKPFKCAYNCVFLSLYVSYNGNKYAFILFIIYIGVFTNKQGKNG
jgi:hypothetical protein